ncbi:hypothetical protein PISMIDRAFT_674969 [Pisolithus microcarpus 441]|uniref:Uncharacterized protein n=1 Tax=Pisolithus microcarpus 441 TaxID=765257 RepID=A0A0C9YPZ7_9AGAM|nr:hypothetical protein PISMIDRAFT_674969 [Pisolithus microcarpus 441]
MQVAHKFVVDRVDTTRCPNIDVEKVREICQVQDSIQTSYDIGTQVGIAGKVDYESIVDFPGEDGTPLHLRVRRLQTLQLRTKIRYR